MEIKGKIYCFFEQSGTFKNEFKKLGYEAFDIDIQNHFNQTDHVIDLFHEIEEAYRGEQSVFDNITKDDLIMAFFPCIYFTHYQRVDFTKESVLYKNLSMKQTYDKIIERQNNRNKFMNIITELFEIVESNNLRMILENPANGYLQLPQNFVSKPNFIDKDRTLRGDYFKKPTAYWFVNCINTYGYSFQKIYKAKSIKKDCKRNNNGGICNEERSMISPDYARNFICDFIIGKKQKQQQLELF